MQFSGDREVRKKTTKLRRSSVKKRRKDRAVSLRGGQ